MKCAMVVLVAGATLLGGCKDKPSEPSPTVTGIVVTGTGAFTTKNQTSQLTATANFSNSNTQNVTNSATWSTGNASVASVSSTGVVTSVGGGSTTIIASYQGQTGSLPVTVSLSADPRVTASFQRLCNPFRARLEITVAEMRGDIGYVMNSLTLTMRDYFGVVRHTRTFTAAQLNTSFGTNRVNAGQSRVLTYEASYPGNVDTEDSTAVVQVSITDDSGNTNTFTVNITFQSDRC